MRIKSRYLSCLVLRFVPQIWHFGLKVPYLSNSFFLHFKAYLAFEGALVTRHLKCTLTSSLATQTHQILSESLVISH